MEKAIYLVWALPADHPDLAARLREEVAPEASRISGVHSVQVNVVDADVQPVSYLPPAPADQLALGGMLNVWLDSARDGTRAWVDGLLDGTAWTGLVVSESEPLPLRQPPPPGTRLDGFAQLALLRRPEHLSPAEWRWAWQEQHTDVAIATQSTFRYVQNLVVRSFGPEVPTGPPIAAVVEECFPTGAMADLQVFYDAVGDDDLLTRRMTEMAESVARFIDGIPELAWTSEYWLPAAGSAPASAS